jgi:hypothetical protein
MAGFALLRRLISFAHRVALGFRNDSSGSRGAPAIMRHNQLVPTCFAAPLAALAEASGNGKLATHVAVAL